jgi:hypothetical protein
MASTSIILLHVFCGMQSYTYSSSSVQLVLPALGYGMICKADIVSPSGHHLSMRQLIVALPLIAPPPPLILSACPCLSMGHLHLPPPVCLSFAPAGCCIASHCAAFATHPLDAQLPLNTPTGCSNASCHPASAALPLNASLPLNMLPPPPNSHLPFVCPGWLSCCGNWDRRGLQTIPFLLGKGQDCFIANDTGLQ